MRDRLINTIELQIVELIKTVARYMTKTKTQT